MQDNLAAGARVDSRRGFRRHDRQPTRDADQSGREEQGEQGDEHEADHDARGGLTETLKFTVGGNTEHATRQAHSRAVGGGDGSGLGGGGDDGEQLARELGLRGVVDGVRGAVKLTHLVRASG